MRIFSKIKSFLAGDLLGYLVNGYGRIPSLYKTTFWTVFVALNIVFAYHTAHFIWGNHEWVYMRTGITWRNFWYEARFTETLPYALFGFELLPILLNEFAFMGLSLSVLALAIYWRLPKEKWSYIGFCLITAFIPYNLSWLYHVAQTTFLWGCLLLVLALSILEKIADKKISQLWHIAIIFLIWFALGFSAAFINTVFICFIGRCLIDLVQGVGIGKLIKKGVIGFADITCAALALKGSIYLADKYGFLGDNFYNVNTIKLNEVWGKLWEVAGYSLEQFTYTYPFFEMPCLILLLLFLALAIITLLWQMLRHRWWLRVFFLFLGFIGILFASQFAIFISENRIKLQFMFRLTGFFSLNFIFAWAVAVVCGFWAKGLWKNILFILMVAGTGLFIQRDMYAMRVWKQGMDAENKLYDRVIGRLENTDGFSYSKRYRVVIIGDPSLRDRYYQGKYKDKDASMLAWSYRCPWTYQAYLNFYAPQDFISGEFQNAWGMKYTEKLFTHLSESTINYIADHAAAWPAQGSVMIRDNIIFIFMDAWETNTFKKMLWDYYQERQAFQTSGQPEVIRVFHPTWGKVNTLRFVTMDRIMRDWSGDAATVLEFDDNRLILRWDNFGTETFIRNGSDIYEYTDDSTPFTDHQIIMASHKDWLPAWKPQGLKFISKNKVMRVANNDIAVVKKFTDTELILDWYAYDEERFVKDENGVYRLQEK
ncbi:MAG: hypothetical protein SPL08_00585 [Pseudomonadota bacterium]|nr:hypothetical protein [Pseudomonadota bacterium]